MQLYTSKTYVLFGGKEVITIFKLSVRQLLMSTDITYNMCPFGDSEQGLFFKEKNKWEDCLEISYDNYIILKEHFQKHNLVLGLPNPKFQLTKILISKGITIIEQTQQLFSKTQKVFFN
ncbi:MAG: hypothetical protein V3V33_05690 [Candidatus Lokiarchaeia archaeon]